VVKAHSAASWETAMSIPISKCKYTREMIFVIETGLIGSGNKAQPEKG
jgi:hypothetical protein